MEEQNDFVAALGNKIQAYAKDLEKTVLPGLKADFYNLNASLTTIVNILKKKGLLSEDPYQYESKISEVSPISSEPFLDGEKSTVMSIRVGSFHHQLNFLNDFYQFSIDFLTLQRLKNISQYMRFIKWDGFSDNHNELNTRVLAELVGRVRKGDDTISAGLLNDAIGQLAGLQNRINEKLKKVTLFKREEYKYTIRITFFESLNLSASEVERDVESAIRRVKKEFATHIKGQPFIPELVKELLDEDFSLGGSRLREDLIKKLEVSEVQREKPKQERNFKADLMESVRTLTSSNIAMESALRKLRESSAVFEDRVHSLGERFYQWLMSLIGVKKKRLFYEVEFFDAITAASRKEVIDFEKFTEELYAKIRVMANISNRNSPAFQVLALKDENVILDWYDRTFFDLIKLSERMSALDIFFKTEVSKDKRPLIRGIKTELSAIRTAISNANKLKHEYVGAKEEIEQLRRLGINN